jgi:Zn-dependent protease
MDSTLMQALALIVPLVIAIVFHEVAHGLTAKALGDPTAAQLGRLSLNPLRHVDLFGTVILPGFLFLSGAPVFGWAKPVPINPRRLRNPRWHMVLVAAAGPLTNIVLAFLAVAAMLPLRATLENTDASLGMAFLATSLGSFISINLFLAVFNMIPVPPFDGSKVLAGFLPDGLRKRFQRLDRYALPIMLGLLVLLPMLGPLYNVVGMLVEPPFRWLLDLIGGILSGK